MISNDTGTYEPTQEAKIFKKKIVKVFTRKTFEQYAPVRHLLQFESNIGNRNIYLCTGRSLTFDFQGGKLIVIESAMIAIYPG